jgi:hypothetical protein
VLGVAGGRTSPNALCRTFRRRFFSPTYQTDKPGVRITKDPVDGLPGTKAGEPICIRQTTGFSSFRHPHIMPKFPTPALRI